MFTQKSRLFLPIILISDTFILLFIPKMSLRSRFSNTCAIIIRHFHLEWSPNKKIKAKIWDRYRDLPMQCKSQLTYVWIDGTGQHLRSKTRTLDYTPSCIKDCPTWYHDGSNTGLAEKCNSDIPLLPVALYADPILQGPNKIVLCETYTADNKPTATNHRHACAAALKQACQQEPMFGFEQEFLLMDCTNTPFGWPLAGDPVKGAYYYGSVGAGRAHGREIVESVYRCCINSGVGVASSNAEATPSQWEIQIGPTVGIKAADDLWMARYLLWRIAEDYGVNVSLRPQYRRDWRGSSCHTNFSTKAMRDAGGLGEIKKAVDLLSKKHKEHLIMYDVSGGRDNAKRLTGEFDSSQLSEFSSGVGNRSASIRINQAVADQKKGYFEDRRPNANSDPYRIATALVKTILLDSAC